MRTRRRSSAVRGRGYDCLISSSSFTRIAYAAFLGMLLIAAGLVLTTDLRVEDIGPMIVFGIAFLSVIYLLFAPMEHAR